LHGKIIKVKLEVPVSYSCYYNISNNNYIYKILPKKYIIDKNYYKL